ncbi:hypothetical protein [Oceanicoccus sp. KOV_DT_Chl]|uniref:hypothetical protein n=1 Tax=Oceanicoccus sp. KOV_DT_Chl TaxID=1904639 RepID=UPI000C7D8335|nr:hypothetical protein [Oceanicoccus sp. KOV_DT_Chl]
MSNPCIFCNLNGKKSKEHLWPEWMHPFLPLEGDGENIRETNTFKWKEQVDAKELKRQGHLTTTKFRVVCRACNSGWMSRLESEVKPMLSKILQNEPVILEKSDQDILSRWIAMKVIVGEYADKDISVTPKNDRNTLRTENKVPDYYAVYIGKHDHSSDSAWLRISQILATSPDGPNPPLGNLNRNSQSVGFICGPLYVFVFATREKGIKSTEFFNLPKMSRIFPIETDKVVFPSQHILTSIDMGKISWALDDMKKMKNVQYIEEIPC